jgi:hypothetical protein
VNARTPQEDVKITVGYKALPGQKDDRLEQRTVQPAAGDAPPWDATTQFALVGTDVDRVDGLAKASGRAKYSYDVTFPGMLQAMILRSPVARGKLTVLELDEAARMPGIQAVVALKEIGNKVRFVGDAIAAVAGVNLHLVRDAIERIRAEYEREEHNVDYLVANDAPMVDDKGLVTEDWPADEGMTAALLDAKVTHDATYRVEVQTHSSLETHGGVARWTGNDLEVWLSTQATFGCRGELARALQGKKVDVGSVTIHSEFVGGGFGSKFGAGIEGLALCLLAHAAKAPVKLMLDRFEEHTTTGNRPGALMQARGGVDAEGRIVAWDWRSFGHAGFSGSGGSVAVPNYYTGDAKVRRSHKDLAIDADPPRPMRAPGHPQGWRRRRASIRWRSACRTTASRSVRTSGASRPSASVGTRRARAPTRRARACCAASASARRAGATSATRAGRRTASPAVSTRTARSRRAAARRSRASAPRRCSRWSPPRNSASTSSWSRRPSATPATRRGRRAAAAR